MVQFEFSDLVGVQIDPVSGPMSLVIRANWQYSSQSRIFEAVVRFRVVTTDVRTTDFVKLGASLLDVLGGIRRRVRKLRPDQGLLASQAEVLRLVVDDPGLSVASLAEVLHVAPNTVSTLLRQLVDHGLIVRYRDGSDRRVARFEPTDAARERLSVNRDRRAAAVSAALHQLPESDREAIANAVPALQRLTEMLS